MKEQINVINKILCSTSLYEIQKIGLCWTGHLPKESAINVTEKHHRKEAVKNIEYI